MSVYQISLKSLSSFSITNGQTYNKTNSHIYNISIISNSGILGKRTKFQQTIIPQLALSSELDSSIERPTAEESHGNAELPPDLELQDDLRLSKIQYTESISQAELPSLEQILCLLTV